MHAQSRAAWTLVYVMVHPAMGSAWPTGPGAGGPASRNPRVPTVRPPPPPPPQPSSRFVGDVFGAPLAIEALLAFFLESTFLGLWIFGWEKLPKKLHLAAIWAAAIGTMLSAYFILAANSWMQHPTGHKINPETGRA